MRVALAVLSMAALAGCSGGPFSEQEKQVRTVLVRHFAELNAQAGVQAQQAKGAASDIDVPPTALVVNRYDWDIAGAIYDNVTCPACQAELGTLAAPGTKVRCAACNQDLTQELIDRGRARPMFEIRSGTSLPIVVIVRYVRHSMVHDPNSSVFVSSKTQISHPIDRATSAEFRGKGAYYAGGFYRTSVSAICTTGFVFQGGDLEQIDPDSVAKMTKDPPEDVKVSSMKLGRWGAVEEARMPWLGRAPAAAAPKEEPKSP